MNFDALGDVTKCSDQAGVIFNTIFFGGLEYPYKASRLLDIGILLPGWEHLEDFIKAMPKNLKRRI